MLKLRLMHELEEFSLLDPVNKWSLVKCYPSFKCFFQFFYCKIFQVNTSRDWHSALVCYLTSNLSDCLEPILMHF